MDNIEQLNRQFLYTHPKCSSPSDGILATTEGYGLHLPIEVNIREYSRIFFIEAFLRNASWKDVQVTATHDSLKIYASIDYHNAINGNDKSYLVDTTHHVGSVTRYIRLPANIDPTRIEYNFSNGVLLLRLPKRLSYR